MLKKYNKKRNFKNTDEPKGATKTKKQSIKKSKIFVVQYHQARANHYDLRLEHKGVLLSWAVPKGLSDNPKDKRLAVMVENHPIEYAKFSGIIPKGNYGAGSVEIFDSGNYEPLESFNTGLKKGHLKFVLNGSKLKGAWSLVKTDQNNWLAIKEKDEFSVTKKSKTSVKNPFKDCDVQLATLSSSIPKGKKWIFEIKYDGYRILAYFQNGKVKLLSRNKKDYTSKFSAVSQSIKKLNKNTFVLDGEIVSFDQNGKSDFGLLQQNIKQNTNNFFYVIFDILALDGVDLRNKPLLERKNILEQMLIKAPNNLMFSKHVAGKGSQVFKYAKDMQLEGIIAKNIDSKYVGKRTEDWLKIKCYLRQEFVICGYTVSSKNKYISAILVGYYYKKDFIFVGKVGTGLNEQQKKELNAKFKKIERKTCPFANNVTEKNAIWLKPQLIAEIQYAELTKSGVLRQPSFVGLRADKDPKKVVLETKNN